MSRKNLIDKCPFRDGTASQKIFVALAKASKPISVDGVSRGAKVPLGKAKTLVAAYFNVMHNAPLRKIGVALSRDKDGLIRLTTCKADPKASRPERGKRFKAKKHPKDAKQKKNAVTRQASKATVKKVAATEPTAPVSQPTDVVPTP